MADTVHVLPPIFEHKRASFSSSASTECVSDSEDDPTLSSRSSWDRLIELKELAGLPRTPAPTPVAQHPSTPEFWGKLAGAPGAEWDMDWNEGGTLGTTTKIWAAETPRAAPKSTHSRHSSKGSIHKPAWARKPKFSLKASKPGITVDTSYSRHHGAPPTEIPIGYSDSDPFPARAAIQPVVAGDAITLSDLTPAGKSLSSSSQPGHKRKRSKLVKANPKLKELEKVRRANSCKDDSARKAQHLEHAALASRSESLRYPRDAQGGKETLHGMQHNADADSQANGLAPNRASVTISPSDRPIPIGIAVPAEQRTLHETSPQSAVPVEKLVMLDPRRDRTATESAAGPAPTIIITPARENSGWAFPSPTASGTGHPPARPPSSVYSQATWHQDHAEGASVPPVPTLPPDAGRDRPRSSRDESDDDDGASTPRAAARSSSVSPAVKAKKATPRDSTMTVFEEDDFSKRKDRIMSTMTVFEEDDTPSTATPKEAVPQLPRNPNGLSIDTALPTPKSRTSGWWDLITTPFGARSARSVRTPTEEGSASPTTPILRDAAAFASSQRDRADSSASSSTDFFDNVFYAPTPAEARSTQSFGSAPSPEEATPAPLLSIGGLQDGGLDGPSARANAQQPVAEGAAGAAHEVACFPSDSRPRQAQRRSEQSLFSPNDREIPIILGGSPASGAETCDKTSPAPALASNNPFLKRPRSPATAGLSSEPPQTRQHENSSNNVAVNDSDKPASPISCLSSTPTVGMASSGEGSARQLHGNPDQPDARAPSPVSPLSASPAVSVDLERDSNATNPKPHKLVFTTAEVEDLQSDSHRNSLPPAYSREPPQNHSAGAVNPVLVAVPAPAAANNAENVVSRQYTVSPVSAQGAEMQQSGPGQSVPTHVDREGNVVLGPGGQHSAATGNVPNGYVYSENRVVTAGFAGAGSVPSGGHDAAPRDQSPPHIYIPNGHDYAGPALREKTNVSSKRLDVIINCFGRKHTSRKKKKKRCYFCYCCCWFLILLGLILGLALGLGLRRHNSGQSFGGSGYTSGPSRPRPSSSSSPSPSGPSQWLNLTNYPPIPTGLSTVIQVENSYEDSQCTSPTTFWQCSVPKEDQDAIKPNLPNQPDFKFEIVYLNSSGSRSKRSLGSSPPTARVRSLLSSLSARADSSGADPPVPGIEDQRFIGNTTDHNAQPFEGEGTPFYISFISPTSTSSRLHRRARDSSASSAATSFPNMATFIPQPDEESDGTAAPANLFPVPTSEPLKLYNRGLPSEHYGFYVYYDRSIFVSNPKNVTNADKNGGASFDTAIARVTWAQTRFLFQIWTKAGASKPLLSSSSTSANAKQPGSFPYPISVTVDRHGGDLMTKLVYLYYMDDQGRITESPSPQVQIETRNHNGQCINCVSGPWANVAVSVENGGPGGIDGGSGGCGCRWANWQGAT